VIAVAEATQQAVRLALVRNQLAAIRDRGHPYQDVPQEAAEVAGRLFRTLAVTDLLRGGAP
jgi:hypothetical protein